MHARQAVLALALVTCSAHAFADDAAPPKVESVVVRRASPSKRAGGVVLTSVGGLFFTAGAALSIGAGVGIAGGRGDLTSVFDLLLGGAAMVVGLATGIPGIVLIATSGEKVAHPIDEAKVATLPTPRAVTIPLVSATF